MDKGLSCPLLRPPVQNQGGAWGFLIHGLNLSGRIIETTYSFTHKIIQIGISTLEFTGETVLLFLK